MNATDLQSSPNPLSRDYSRFRVSERLLLTGHSHQAWPDCGFAAQQQAWLDAAELVDDKWPRVFAKVEEVRRGYARLLGGPPPYPQPLSPGGARGATSEADADIALDQNTLELVVRFISALPLRSRPRLVSTNGEFHTLRRLLDRLAEEDGIEVVRVASDPVATLAERLSAAIDDRTAAAFCSTVMFRTAHIVPGLPHLAATCQYHGAELLLDAYHHLNVVPFNPTGLERAYVVGGGYKYCQLGEGVCFLRLPEDCTLRPITTGWFTEFDELASKSSTQVGYGRGAMRFAGATFDPTSYYRAAAVFAYLAERGLTPTLLREVSQHQVRLLAERFDALDLDPAMIRRDRTAPLEEVGGFLVLVSPQAGAICTKLKEAGVWTDHRGDALRLGPAPYLSDAQLIEAMERLVRVIKV
jgi:kynureninase